jgi:hypothetical protein
MDESIGVIVAYRKPSARRDLWALWLAHLLGDIGGLLVLAVV